MKKVHFSILMAIMCCLFFMISCGGGGGGGTQVVSELPTPDISVSKTNVDVGGVVRNSSAVQTLTIQSTGTANLSIGQIQILGTNSPFSIDTLVSTCASTMTLAPAQTCSLTVRFSPTTTAHLGIVNGTLRINSNDPNASTVDVSLGGTGYGLNVWINKIVTAQCEANVDVTVTDPTNNNILALTQSNFTLSENGQQVQSFTASQIAYPAPVTLLLALDWSESTINVRPQLKAGAESFINLFSSQDLAGICKFASTVEFYPNPLPPFIAADASGKTSLNSYIYGDPSLGLNTSLYEAVYQSIDKVAQETGKRVVIVLSDGHEVSSGTYTLAQVIASAKSNGIPIFTIYYNDPQYQGGNYGKPEIMQQLANETGGQYYSAPTGADFASIFQQIANVLSNKYTLTYTSSICPGTVSLNVRAELNGLYGQDSRAISF